MMTIPAIDMVATGRNIMKLRKAAGLSVREIQNIFWIYDTTGYL